MWLTKQQEIELQIAYVGYLMETGQLEKAIEQTQILTSMQREVEKPTEKRKAIYLIAAHDATDKEINSILGTNQSWDVQRKWVEENPEIVEDQIVAYF